MWSCWWSALSLRAMPHSGGGATGRDSAKSKPTVRSCFDSRGVVAEMAMATARSARPHRAARTFRIAAVVGVLLGPLSVAHAVGNVMGATVVSVDSRADGYFLVTFSQGRTTPPSCVTVSNRMSGNANTAGGRAVLASALLAYSAASRVELAQGTGACAEYAGIESRLILQQSR